MFTDINNIIEHRGKKLVIALIILTMLSYVLLNFIGENQVLATQTRESYSDKINNYPGYKELIEKMKQAHPNWSFTIFYTGLDWYQVIKNETTAYHGRNVVPVGKSSAWKCSTCGDTPVGGDSWRCASEAAVAYYMDPRNWINDTYIFEFENLSYNSEIQTLEGVQKIIAGIKYMQGDNITYTTTNGSKATLNKSYAQVIFEAAQELKISPYHLASRIRQEQGTGSIPGSTATGNYPGYVGYYNFLNIKASGKTNAQVIANGLNHAKENGWDNPEISIKEGAKLLASNYINVGQDTLYLQKFDVDSSNGTGLYYHQYMQNVTVCASEGLKPKQTYEELGVLDSKFEFVIPVYENMPDTPCPEPAEGEVVTQNIKVTGNDVSIRNGASISATRIASVNKGDILLRIEIAEVKNGSYYWDKVVLPDGTKGYMARNYIEKIDDVTNCNDTVFTNTSANLRNGPGITGTNIVTTLIEGQALTRIETGKYNIDGYIWDRVKLADGRQGYIAQNYIGLNKNDNTGTEKTELVEVICKSGVNVRENPGTDQNILVHLPKGTILTRTKMDVSNNNGYVWDKIVTAEGIEGYIARGDSIEPYIQVVTQTTPETKNNNFKIEDSNLVSEPDTTVESIKEKYNDTEIVVKKPDGTVVKEGDIGTGYTITIGDKSYTSIKMGDINGDGIVDAIDLLKLRRVLLEKDTIDGVFKDAANVYSENENESEMLDAVDLLKIRRFLLTTDTINI